MEAFNIESLIEKHGLKSHAEEINSLACRSIRLLASPASGQGIVIGGSRLGGQPDLPPGFQWPACRDQPMSFVVQICLEDVAGFAPAQDLPSSGLLSFFYDSKQETY